MSQAWQLRLETVLRSWWGTPFSPGLSCRGRGTDCFGLLTGVLDDLYRVTVPRPPRVPLDTGWNNEPGRLAAIRRFTGRYPCRPLHLARESPEPGDVLILCRPGRDPERAHHGAIVGVGEPPPIWHAGMGGVSYTSLAAYRCTRGFRMLEKERWEVT